MNEIGEKFLLYGFLDGCSYETDGTNNAILALETGERIEVPIVEKNQELFSLAWIFSCTVKEKRYLVKVRGISEYSAYLNRDVATNKWFMSSENDYPDKTRTHHTRPELEKAGFGWVLDCPGIEIEEVEE